MNTAEKLEYEPIVVVEEALARYRVFSDGGANVHHLMYRYYEAINRARGEGAIEIGVRAGGVSAMMNMIAEKVIDPQRGFMVFSVDPYGSAPYRAGHEEVPLSPYHDGFYLKAKELLLPYERSILLRMESALFTRYLAREIGWWSNGQPFPTEERWISFVYLDGQHGPKDVTEEVDRLIGLMAPGGLMVVDDVQYIPEVVRQMERVFTPPYVVEHFPSNRLGIHIPKEGAS